jgi:hypothetical protein
VELPHLQHHLGRLPPGLSPRIRPEGSSGTIDGLDSLDESGYPLWVDFEWDPAKAAKNLRKHRVSLPEATTVFGIPWESPFPIPITLKRRIDTLP